MTDVQKTVAVAVVSIAVGVGIVAALTSCATASYATATEKCRINSRTCEEYIACRTDVETEAGHVWKAHCADGGAP